MVGVFAEKWAAATPNRFSTWSMRFLAEAGMSLGMLDGIAASVGPGAFTGVRIGVSVAQGLAFGAALPVVAVTTLEALGWQAMRGGADQRHGLSRCAHGRSVLGLLRDRPGACFRRPRSADGGRRAIGQGSAGGPASRYWSRLCGLPGASALAGT